ncbi:hypothetical protein TgHK011_001879 [Trichoderma gracile]|nr:hypothetical protein TgHK011_001879 [Trichoderma gracile]
MADAASSIDWLADSSRCIGYGCWLPAMERAEASWQSSLLGTTLSDKFGVGIVPDQLKQPSCHGLIPHHTARDTTTAQDARCPIAGKHTHSQRVRQPHTCRPACSPMLDVSWASSSAGCCSVLPYLHQHLPLQSELMESLII